MSSTTSAHEAPSLITPVGYRSNTCGYCKGKRSKCGKQKTKSRESLWWDPSPEYHNIATERILSPEKASYQRRAYRLLESLPDFDADTLHLYTGYSKHIANHLAGRSYYCLTPSLSPSLYASLLSRGFRRSGTLLYKPDLKHSCCAQYTIRLEASKFKPAKDQRQAINRFNAYILGDEYIRARERLRPKTKEEAKRYKQEFDLTERIHEAESTQLGPPLVGKDGKEIKPAHELVVSLEPDDLTEEKYILYENYQRNVHHEKTEDISRAGFKRFLCESPLQRIETWSDKDGKLREVKLGSYHQCYRLDGKLVAMAVLDLLPKVVSGVYFLYHEDLHKWSPGKLSALRETALAIEEGYEFYWMGYYIQSCVKMRYKGDYMPIEFLDPESYEWHLLDAEAKRSMGEKNYISLSTEAESGDGATSAQATVYGSATTAEDGGEVREDDDSDYEAEEVDGTVWDNDMPGVMSKAEVSRLDLGSVKLSLRGKAALCEDVIVWERGTLDDPTALKCWIGELAACVGPEVAGEMVVKF